MRPVRWSAKAKTSIGEVFDYYLYADLPEVTHRITRRITAAGDALGEYSTGRPSWVAGTYLKSITDMSYLLVYRVEGRGDAERIVILDVVHTRRDWIPGDLPPKPKPR